MQQPRARRRIPAFIGCVAALVLLNASPAVRAAQEPIRPVPAAQDLDPARVALGERLFHDPRLSRTGRISCASCHGIATAGVDGRRYSLGVEGREGKVNTPTVFNAKFNIAQFWDGRAVSLEQQVDGPLHNPDEMDTDWSQVIAKLHADSDYVALFREAFGERPSEAAVKSALADYQRSLVTVDAPFDRYLRGDDEALTPLQREGYRLFKAYGCISCHQGVNVGGNMYATMGAMGDYFADQGSIAPQDYGRHNVTGRETDRFVFKVPGLRLAAATAPYFHDGSAATLKEAIGIMGEYQLGRTIPEGDIARLAAFIESLQGEYRRMRP